METRKGTILCASLRLWVPLCALCLLRDLYSPTSKTKKY